LTIPGARGSIAFVIRSFAGKRTEALFRRQPSKLLPPELRRAAYRKLVMLDSAVGLRDLAVPPGNRLEALTGDRKGRHSIRINDRWRICFVWLDGNAWNVEIVDYH